MATAAAPEDQAAITAWRSATGVKKEELFDQLIRDGLFPPDVVNQWEVGLYPDLPSADDQFIPKLMRKREMVDTKHEALAKDADPCRSTEGFELTPTQRFVSTFLSPRTPYNGMLLYHGVGVGKTCAAVTTCESWLEMNPKRSAYIVAPPTIQEGFQRTIFDRSSLVIGRGTEPNRHNGCTGDLYLVLTGMVYERDVAAIERAVGSLVRKRYKFFGYYAFYKEIVRTKQLASGSEQNQVEELRRVFSNRLLVIDEAHNLRDAPDEGAEDAADDVSVDIQGSAEGKKLTPMLKEVLKASEGIKLLLMTATPMYNSYKEIIFLLDLLRMNDVKQSTVRFQDIFTTVKSTAAGTTDFEFTTTGRRALGALASAYISFMRGENPASFPIRLEPQTGQRLTVWPQKTPRGEAITSGREVARLPCVGCYFSKATEEFYKASSTEAVKREGLSITVMDKLIQGGNWLFPVEDAAYEDRIQQVGFDATFEKEMKGTVAQYRDVDEGRHSSWLLDTALPEVSGKAAYLLKRLAKTKGVAFVYSRFVATGALTLALALEANGYTPASGTPLLADGNQHPQGRQCAMCELHERGHSKDHTFVAAKYVLLTGSVELTPNTRPLVDAVRARSNLEGADVKVVLGSQIAGEGLDLRYIRELFVFDSWYHLNKLEQIIGRGVRNCSHAALPREKRNTTISLLVNAYSSEPSLETVDTYSYRTALLKANIIGKVSRVLKEYAMDCTLTREAVILKDLDPVDLVDGQGKERKGVNVNDVPFTALCDWLDTCEYECLAGTGEGASEGEDATIDSSTYDDYTLRYKEKKVRKVIEDLIVNQGQVSIRLNQLEASLQSIPPGLLLTLINDLLDKEFIIQTKAGPGRVLMKNQMLVFQPEVFRGLTIPTAVRMLPVPVARDSVGAKYAPVITEEETVEEPEAELERGEGDSEPLWEAAVAWSEAIREGRAEGVPTDVKNELPSVGGTSIRQKELLERLGSIVWLYESARDSGEARATLAAVVLDFFWDEVITLPTRRALLTAGSVSAGIRDVASDSFWELEGTTYVRLHNTDTGDTEYFTVGATGAVPTIKSVEEILKRETASDPLIRPVNTNTTGARYGFLVQRGPRDLLFKVTEPPAVGKKVGRGSACSSSSAVKFELAQLERLGKILREAGRPDLGLNDAELGGRRAIKNANRICTVSDLALRWMDRARIQGKRWFYRALQSKLTGHRNR